MPEFVTRPRTATAWRYEEGLPEELPRTAHSWNGADGRVYLNTVGNGPVPVNRGDWIILESDGEHAYPCTNEEFEARYVVADEAPSPTKWTQAMDGSGATVDLFEVMRRAPRDRGEPPDAGFWADIARKVWGVKAPFDWGTITWQHGPIQEVGRNGILFEELLEFVLIPRLEGFNRDRIPNPDPGVDAPDTIPNPFRNRETSLAITHLEEALNWLKRRTEKRRRQGVEGTFQPHS